MQFLSQFYESIFSAKTYKLSLDAGCTCPNRDGTKGTGGCIFCSESGSGDFASSRNLSVKEQVAHAKKLVESKVKGRSGKRAGTYIAYFQNFTSTYGEPKPLLAKYREALSCEDVKGLAIATRPDCLGDEILSGIAAIAQEHFVQIELGLQTSNETTGRLINRCHANADYSDAVRRIRAANPRIHIVTHLIFGLPGETRRDMLESVRFVVQENCRQCESESDCESADSRNPRADACNNPRADTRACTGMPKSFFGLKITVLYVVKNTRLAQMYEKGEIAPLSKDEYYSLLKETLSLLPESCVIHRLTGDPPKASLIAPLWTADKKRVLNEIRALCRDLTPQ